MDLKPQANSSIHFIGLKAQKLLMIKCGHWNMMTKYLAKYTYFYVYGYRDRY